MAKFLIAIDEGIPNVGIPHKGTKQSQQGGFSSMKRSETERVTLHTKPILRGGTCPRLCLSFVIHRDHMIQALSS